MGASEIGEIKNLCRIAKPTSGLITNIGKAHLEGFGSFEGVIKAKTELYHFLEENNGTQFVNRNDDLLIKKSDEESRITYGKESNSDFIAKLTSSFPFISVKIKNLCRIAKPTSGLITNIGKAHLEGFGSFEGIIKAKTELYHFLEENNGTQFINRNDDLLVKKSDEESRITYGNESNSDCKSKLTSSFPFISVTIKDTLINSNLVGEFQYDNIVAASCIGDFYNISLKNIKKTIESYIPKNNRTELIETEDNNIILDAYNANPSSMESMIESFIKLDKPNKICILGEMRELGAYSEEEHQKIINQMNASEIESIFIGEEFLRLTKKNTYLKISELINNITRYNLKNRTILIKGSRGIKLENLVKYL